MSDIGTSFAPWRSRGAWPSPGLSLQGICPYNPQVSGVSKIILLSQSSQRLLNIEYNMFNIYGSRSEFPQ